MKKCLVWVLVITLCMGLLAACGGKSAATEQYRGNALEDAAEGYVEYSTENGSTSLSGSAAGGTQPAATNQKLIRKVYLEAETEDLDALLDAVMKKISQLGGYVEQQEVYYGSPSAQRRYRRGTLTLRIPAEKLDDFVAKVTESSNIVSSNETTENVTLTYVATQSRIKALETEQTRLLELLAKAETTKDLLEIESRLTEVRTELEKVTSQLRALDNQVDYGTVNLTISEVKEYTVVEEPESIWQRIGTGFMDSLKNLGNFFTELFVFVVVAFPYLLLIGGIAVAVILIIRFRRKRSKKASNQNFKTE